MLVLDACHSNPLADDLRRSISTSRALLLPRGLAKIEAPHGMIVAYSTQAGRTAEDGAGRNSPYTTAFLRHIEGQEEIGTIFRRVSADVYDATRHEQLPELSLSFIGEFYFKGKPAVTASIAPQLDGNRAPEEPPLKQEAPKEQASKPIEPRIGRSCANPNALGVSRVVMIDTAGGPGFGFEHFKQFDFLRDKEVVLTFDDGPWPVNTPAVLKALAEECTTGIFFPIGKHASYYPEILRQVAAAGHTIGSHTWTHAALTNRKLTEQQRMEEIEKGFSAVKWALDASPSPFFRFPALQHPPEMVTYLGTRDIAIFSCDLDSFNFKAVNARQVIDVTMQKLYRLGKGIIMLHDFNRYTAEAIPELLLRLKAGGYKVVRVTAKTSVQTLANTMLS